MSRKRVLLVDDESEILAVVREILEIDGWDVRTAADGAEALRAIGRDAYDAVLSDVKMPVLDGPALFREIRARYPELSRRTAFLAAPSDMTDELRDAGVPMLAKPFDVHELRRVVRELASE